MNKFRKFSKTNHLDHPHSTIPHLGGYYRFPSNTRPRYPAVIESPSFFCFFFTFCYFFSKSALLAILYFTYLKKHTRRVIVLVLIYFNLLLFSLEKNRDHS